MKDERIVARNFYSHGRFCAQWIPILGLSLAHQLVAVPEEGNERVDLAEVAALAVKMSGGDVGGAVPARYRLVNELPFPEEAQWFKDAGLGLFIHWGPASVPGIEDVWRIRQPQKEDPTLPKVTPEYYYDNAPKEFTAANYDPERWLEAARKAGFRYSILTSKHHDGYALWPSKHSDFGVKKYLNGRDLIQPFVDAARNNDMKFGFYFSGVDWWRERNYMNYFFGGDVGWDFHGNPMRSSELKILPMDIVETKKRMAFEVMERYRPDVWWWDTGLPVTIEETALKYNPGMIFNNRGNWYHEGRNKGMFPGSHFITPEGFPSLEWKHVKPMIKNGTPWEICMTLNRSGWFYFDPYGEEVLPLVDIMYAFARIRSWEGNMLLNVSPREDGTLPEAVYEAFDKMARWMAWGGVSVHRTKGTHFPERSNVPITRSLDGKTWWLHARPGAQTDADQWGSYKRDYYKDTEPGSPIRVRDVPEIQSMNLLRNGEAVEYSHDDGNLAIPNPDAGPDGLHEVIEVRFK